MFPWRHDVLSEQNSSSPSSSNKTNHDVNNIVDKNYQRPNSQIGFEKVFESTYTNGTSVLLVSLLFHHLND